MNDAHRSEVEPIGSDPVVEDPVDPPPEDETANVETPPEAGTEDGAIALLGNVVLEDRPVEELDLVLERGARVLLKLSGDIPSGR